MVCAERPNLHIRRQSMTGRNLSPIEQNWDHRNAAL
jgi:hypothetical protein